VQNSAVCTNYAPPTRLTTAAARLGVAHWPVQEWSAEVFPGYEAPIVVRGQADGAAQCLIARFGLVPSWCKTAQQATELSRGTYNARSETAPSKPSFRAAWRERRWALVPMQHFFEPCWETGRAVRWQISRSDGEPFAVAGLWEHWSDPQSTQQMDSFTLLTVNADAHALMGRMHRPGDEKRMPLIVPPTQYVQWLNSDPQEALAFMQRTDEVDLTGQAAPRTPAVQNPNLSLF
jgi:putative SOS response-associated peptidase YedK